MPENGPRWARTPVEGSVTNREDPDGLGRIKANIPGCLEPESPWIEPLVQGGGTANRGTVEPPAIGANVCVVFPFGDPRRGRYIGGSWGAPGGAADTPADAGVEGDNRQNAVTEDEEWRVERDSRSSSKRLSVRHKESGLEVVIDADEGKIYLVEDGATQALVLGTDYRSHEATTLADVATGLAAAGASLVTAGQDPTLVGLASTAAEAIEAAGNALNSTASGLSGSDLASDATAFLSEEAFTE